MQNGDFISLIILLRLTTLNVNILVLYLFNISNIKHNILVHNILITQMVLLKLRK